MWRHKLCLNACPAYHAHEIDSISQCRMNESQRIKTHHFRFPTAQAHWQFSELFILLYAPQSCQEREQL